MKIGETRAITAKLQGGTILVVDDMPEVLELLTDILAEEGYLVHTALNGKLALASVAASTPELILLDVAMPEMDGFEVLRQLKSIDKYRHIPIMFLTACIDTQSLLEGFKMGAVDYISKPCLREELLARVSTQMELARMRSHLEQQNTDLRMINTQLQETLSSVKILRGLIPICANCKKIRDDAGYWQAVEQYIMEHSEALFSHGICPDCMNILYPQLGDVAEESSQ
jgi:CheY-like chemotaxis protein